jgi:hypothetical protein
MPIEGLVTEAVIRVGAAEDGELAYVRYRFEKQGELNIVIPHQLMSPVLSSIMVAQGKMEELRAKRLGGKKSALEARPPTALPISTVSVGSALKDDGTAHVFLRLSSAEGASIDVSMPVEVAKILMAGIHSAVESQQGHLI